VTLEALDHVLAYLRENHLKVAAAESCTAGLLVGTLADIPGCAEVFECGFIVYTEAAKRTYLGVKPDTMTRYGLTSEEVAREMVQGLAHHTQANFFISITGTAESDDHLNGVVCFGFGMKKENCLQIESETKRFYGERNSVRKSAAAYAIQRIPEVHSNLQSKIYK